MQGTLWHYWRMCIALKESHMSDSPLLAFSGIRNGLARDLLFKLFDTYADCFGGYVLIST